MRCVNQWRFQRGLTRTPLLRLKSSFSWKILDKFKRFRGCSLEPPPPPHTHTHTHPHTHTHDSKFHFHGKFWINLKDLEYHVCPKYSNIHTLALCRKLLFNKSVLLPVSVCTIAELVTNSVDHDQIPHSAASDLGLRCLLKSVCPSTQSKYCNCIKSSWILPVNIVLRLLSSRA